MYGHLAISTLAEAERYCHTMARREAKNFYWGFISLPREQRNAIYALYDFARQVDDEADAAANTPDLPGRLRRHRERLAKCVRGEYGDDPVMQVLSVAVARFSIPERELQMLVDGCEMDGTKTRPCPDPEFLRQLSAVHARSQRSYRACVPRRTKAVLLFLAGQKRKQIAEWISTIFKLNPYSRSWTTSNPSAATLPYSELSTGGHPQLRATSLARRRDARRSVRTHPGDSDKRATHRAAAYLEPEEARAVIAAVDTGATRSPRSRLAPAALQHRRTRQRGLDVTLW